MEAVKNTLAVCHKFGIGVKNMRQEEIDQIPYEQVNIGTALLMHNLRTSGDFFAALEAIAPDDPIKISIMFTDKIYHISFICIKTVLYALRRPSVFVQNTLKFISDGHLPITPLHIHKKIVPKYEKNIVIGCQYSLKNIAKMKLKVTMFFSNKELNTSCWVNYDDIMELKRRIYVQTRSAWVLNNVTTFIDGRPVLLLIDGKPLCHEAPTKQDDGKRGQLPILVPCHKSVACMRPYCIFTHRDKSCKICLRYFAPAHIIQYHSDAAEIVDSFQHVYEIKSSTAPIDPRIARIKHTIKNEQLSPRRLAPKIKTEPAE